MLRLPAGAPKTVARVLQGGPLGIASTLFGFAGRLRPPSSARAAAALAKLIPAALQGNLQAVRAILFRTNVGIASERAVWSAAAAGLPAVLVRQANAKAAALDAATDHSTPETVVRTVLGRGTAFTPFVGAPSFGKGFAGDVLTADVGGMAVSTGRRSSRKRQRRAKRRTVSRYNPDTGRKQKVPADSEEAETWPSRKPRRRRLTRYERRAITQTGRQVERAIGAGARRAVAAVGAAGARVGLGVGASAAYLAAAGLIAYAVTRELIKAKREGDTLTNAYSVAVARAHRLAAQRLGRQVTREELRDLRQRIAQQLQRAITAGTLPAPLGAVYSLINRLIGR